MSELIRISVIIPTFNRATTIGYCIKSIINQTYQPYEIIIVDDCSTDRTIEVIKSFNDPKIRVIQLTKRSGAQAARNRGIYESKGEWIAFQDSDDEWRSNKLEEQIKVLNKEHNSKNLVIYTGAIYKNYKNGRYYNYPIPNISSKNAYKELLRNPGPMFQGMLVSKQCLEKIGFLDENVQAYQEWDTSIRLAKICKFVYINKPMFIYHIHKEETISKNIFKEVNGYDFIVKKFRSDILRLCSEDTWYSHQRVQIIKIMNFNLWDEAKKRYNIIYFSNIVLASIIYFMIIWKIKPFYLSKIIKFLPFNNKIRR